MYDGGQEVGQNPCRSFRKGARARIHTIRIGHQESQKEQETESKTHRHGRSDNSRSILLATLGGALILTGSQSLRGVLHDDGRKGQFKHLWHSGLKHSLDADEGGGDFLNELDLALLAEELHANGLLGGFGGGDGAIAIGRGGRGSFGGRHGGGRGRRRERTSMWLNEAYNEGIKKKTVRGWMDGRMEWDAAPWVGE